MVTFATRRGRLPAASSASDKLLVSMKFTRTAVLVADFPVFTGAVRA